MHIGLNRRLNRHWIFAMSMLISAYAAPGLLLPGVAAAQKSEQPREVIAAQIRKQGFECDKPKSAKRDAKASKSHEAVWTLQCGNASYRVRLVPDKAADVKQID